MKKVGILTLPLNDNYGGILQAIALYGYLTEKNYNVIFLDNNYLKPKWKKVFWFIIEKIPFHNFKGCKDYLAKKKIHAAFINQNIPQKTFPLNSIADFKKVINLNAFDAVIVGSDQVWRWDYILDGFERYFLSFLDGVATKRVAYAASFGKSLWQSPQHQATVSALLNKFDAVSTREIDAVDVVKSLSSKSCEQVLDPTLLVDKSFYDKFLVKSDSETTKNKHKLLTYLLDETQEKNQFVERVHGFLGEGYDLTTINMPAKLTIPEWLQSFYSSDFVITDSFHGMVFSIIFNKQFLVVSNSARGVSRFKSLLSQLDISSRLIDEDSLETVSAEYIINANIDYDKVDLYLEKLRRQSSNFLDNSLR